MRTSPILRELALGDAPQAWSALGFAVAGAACRIEGVTLGLTGAGGGVLGWTLEGEGDGPVDGLPTTWVAPGAGAAAPAGAHPNGITRIDHLVVLTDALERTTDALTAAGAEVRRVRTQGRRQAFLWLGDVICEVVEGGDGPPRFWGLTLVSADLEATAERFGPLVGRVRDAVQPGRRIATVRREAGLGAPVALMSPHEKGSNPSRDSLDGGAASR